MDTERDEVYERIPWETLEKRGGDRQWLVYSIAGAVVLGALAYSFMRNQPTAAPPSAEGVTTTAPATVSTESNIGSTPSTVASPVVVAEADLYAVDPELLVEQASSHAEWFAVEYMAVDGTEVSRELLSALLPEGVPVPEAAEGTQVFVDWSRAMSATQTGPLSFDVAVLVRSLVSDGEAGFVRQEPQIVTVAITMGEDGRPGGATAPRLTTAVIPPPAETVLGAVPEELAGRLEADHGTVVGGYQQDDGSWQVVVMAEGADGVRRPVTVTP